MTNMTADGAPVIAQFVVSIDHCIVGRVGHTIQYFTIIRADDVGPTLSVKWVIWRRSFCLSPPHPVKFLKCYLAVLFMRLKYLYPAGFSVASL